MSAVAAYRRPTSLPEASNVLERAEAPFGRVSTAVATASASVVLPEMAMSATQRRRHRLAKVGDTLGRLGFFADR
ncbi:MAG: hypothetical protein SNJ61_09225, partial [Fimbriimonadaceae bacterium]